MSRFRRAAAAVVLASLVAAASARPQGLRQQFGVGASLAVPVGDYHATATGEGFNTGWQGMGLVAFTLPTGPLGFRVDATYGRNGGNDQLDATLTTKLGQPTTETAKLLGGNLDLTYAFRSTTRMQPYLLGGLGIYHLTLSVTSGGATADHSATKVAWNLGAGTTYQLTGVTLFLEARYVNMAAAATFPRATVLPITAGVRLGGR